LAIRVIIAVRSDTEGLRRGRGAVQRKQEGFFERPIRAGFSVYARYPARSMSDARRVLHQFPISHYCEKTRWHLDLKRLDYRLRNLLPGVHVLVNRRVAGLRTVPVLVDGGKAIGDSTAIAMHLEEQYPAAPLLPRDAAERARVLETETYFDETLGPAVRSWVYGNALATPGMIPALFFRSYGTIGRPARFVMGGVLEREIRRMYRLNAEKVAEASRQIDEAVGRLERLIDGDPNRHLVGGGLTLADITAASLLAPLVGPPESPWTAVAGPAVLPPRREALRARPAGQWVLARYAKDRPSKAN
jgi:glutathione S-transferase